ncbi:MAG TPA: hypothetical protein EYN66_07145 [Myxococcales bacterium]|nr:hypothetical protein [Myxococcales bacterium]
MSRSFDEHSDLVAQMVQSLGHLGDLSKNFPKAQLAPQSTLGDEMLAMASQMTTMPSLMRDLLDAMAQPSVSVLLPALVDLMTYRSALAMPTIAYENCFWNCDAAHQSGSLGHAQCVRNCPADTIFAAPVNENALGANGNRSNLERLIHLFYAISGVEFEMSITQMDISVFGFGMAFDDPSFMPPMLRIPDAGAALVKSVIGRMHLKNYVTPEALKNGMVDKMLWAFDKACDPGKIVGFFMDLGSFAIPNKFKLAFGQACNDFMAVNQQYGLSQEEYKRQRISHLLVVMSHLTDTPFSASPSASEMGRYFMDPTPEIDVPGMTMSLSQLKDRDGFYLYERNGDMMFAAEASGLLDAFAPLLIVFDNHGAPEMPIQLMDLLHRHWATPGTQEYQSNGNPVALSNSAIVRFEPLLKHWLTNNRLLPAFISLINQPNLKSQTGRTFSQVMDEMAKHLFEISQTVTHRSGGHFSKGSNGEYISPISRSYVLLDALAGLSKHMDQAPQTERLSQGLKALAPMLEVQSDGAGKAYFVDQAAMTVASMVMGVVSQSLNDAHASGQSPAQRRDQWLNDVQTLVSSDGLGLAMEWAHFLDQRPGAKPLLNSLFSHLLETPTGRQQTLLKAYELLVGFSDELGLVQAAPFYGSLLDPERVWSQGANNMPLVSTMMALFQRIRSVDSGAVLATMMTNALTRKVGVLPEGAPYGAYPISGIGRVIKAYRRVDPSQITPLNSADYQLIGLELSNWLLDGERGLEKMFKMVQARIR